MVVREKEVMITFCLLCLCSNKEKEKETQNKEKIKEKENRIKQSPLFTTLTLGGLKQRLMSDTGITLTHFIQSGWVKNNITSTLTIMT